MNIVYLTDAQLQHVKDLIRIADVQDETQDDAYWEQEDWDD